MATGDRTGDQQGAETDNVIRFPKDWFGPREELVPFGPAADRRAEEERRVRQLRLATEPASRVSDRDDRGRRTDGRRGEGRWEDRRDGGRREDRQPEAPDEVHAIRDKRRVREPEDSFPPSPSVVSAADFWGEGAESLHQAVQTPLPGEIRSVPHEITPRETTVARDATPVEPVVPGVAAAPRVARDSAIRRYRVPSFWVRRGLAAVVAVLLVGLVVGKLITGPVGGAARSAVHQTAGAGDRLTASTDKIGTGQVAADHGRSIAAIQSALRAKRRRSRTRVHARARVKDGARHNDAARHASRARRSAAHVATLNVDTPSSASSASEPPVVDAAADSSEVESSQTESESTSTGGAAGPIGTGGTVGDNCNPKCQS